MEQVQEAHLHGSLSQEDLKTVSDSSWLFLNNGSS